MTPARTHFSLHIEFNNFKANIMPEPLHWNFPEAVISYICFIGICRSKEYGIVFAAFWSENGYSGFAFFWCELGNGFRGNA